MNFKLCFQYLASMVTIYIQGAARGGGVLYDPDEIRELVYSQGLGEETNNMTEALSLSKGLTQARDLGINEIMVIGYSQILIQAMVTNSLPNQMKLWQLLNKIQQLSKSFQNINFFHVLRQLNGEADHAAKAATPLNKGQIYFNGTFSFTPFP
jgi:ribonuclease HI